MVEKTYRDATFRLTMELHAINRRLARRLCRRERKLWLARFEGVKYALDVLRD